MILFECWAIKVSLEEIVPFLSQKATIFQLFIYPMTKRKTVRQFCNLSLDHRANAWSSCHVAKCGLRALVPSWVNSKFLTTRIYAICLNFKYCTIKNIIRKIFLTSAVTANIPETNYLRDFTGVEENYTEKNISHVRSKEKACFSRLCIITICLPSSVHQH